MIFEHASMEDSREASMEDYKNTSTVDSKNKFMEDSKNVSMEASEKERLKYEKELDSWITSISLLEPPRLFYFSKSSIQSIITTVQEFFVRHISNAVHGTSIYSIPFSVDDISKSLVTFADTNVDVPAQIRNNPCFNFLHERTD
uniref:Uncharacterized protein n=2 Tax=Aegilops tauschii TaxID=37682 RepID=A0A452XPM2_AEGTS